MTKPLVTVLMPVRNTEKYVEQAIQSILNQSFREFELIIIDDGSTDGTLRILKQFHSKCMKIYTQESRGIIAALNRGLSLASGTYIARMDADDISLPERLSKQIEILESHPDIGIVGSAVRVIDGTGKKWGVQSIETTDIGIRWVSLLKSPFVHPAVMFRKTSLDNNHLEYGSLPYAEDYELWTKLLRYTQGLNIGQPLLLYRLHRSNVSFLRRNIQFASHYAISREAIRYELPQLKMDDEQIVGMISLALASLRELAKMGKSRTEGILTYLLLWQAFAEKHEFELGLEQVRRSVVVRAVTWTLFPPLPPRFQGIFHLINQIDRRWPIHFLATLPKNVVAFARERLVWRL